MEEWKNENEEHVRLLYLESLASFSLCYSRLRNMTIHIRQPTRTCNHLNTEVSAAITTSECEPAAANPYAKKEKKRKKSKGGRAKMR